MAKVTEISPTRSFGIVWLIRHCLVIGLVTGFLAPQAWANDPSVAALVNGDHFAIMRHAIAPGNGDPSNFDVNDCSTQRNLSDVGREQAQRTGQFLRDQGAEKLLVYSSQWCRCHDTATLLAFGDVQSLEFLNSFYEARENESFQTQQLIAWLQDNVDSSPKILVTHQVNITALTGVYPASGEIIVARIDEQDVIKVVGTLNP